MQDIVPGRSIRDIPVPNRADRRPPQPTKTTVSRETVRVERVERPKEEEKIDIQQEINTLQEVRQEFEAEKRRSTARRKRKGGIGKVLLVLAVVLAVVALALALSSVFHSATVTLSPKSAQAALADEILAKKAGVPTDLVFQPLTLEETGSRLVKATGEKRVTTQASGTIVIYNNHSATAQRLVKNTRFETPEGLVYRIADSVTVPGKSGTTPGSVEAVVFADEAGEKYNVGLKDFTIPGFKGDPRYQTFYARSKTPLEGGFNGMVKVVPDADLAKAQADIKAEATAALLARAKAETPASAVLFDGAQTVACSPLPQENASSDQVLIKMRCTLSAALFDREALSSHLARANVSRYDGQPIVIRNLDQLSFSPKQGFDPLAQTVSFTLSGDAAFEYLYDEAALKERLAGIRKEDAQSALQSFPAIERASSKVYPAWRNVFPDSPDDITIRKAE